MNLSGMQKYHGTIICFLVFLLCPLAFFFSRSATWILTVGGVISFFSIKDSVSELLVKPFILSVLSLILWGAISSLWSFDPLTSLSLTARLLANFVLGISWATFLFKQPYERIQRIIFSLVAGVCTAAILLLADYFLDNPWQTFLNVSSAKAFVPLVIMLSTAAWPIALWLASKYNPIISVLFLGATALLLMVVDCDTAPLSIVIGLVIGGLAYKWLSFTIQSGKVISAIFIMSLPFVVNHSLTFERIYQINDRIDAFSHIHRLYTWKDISQKIEKKWVLGYGLDTSRHEIVGGEIKEWPLKKRNGKNIFIHTKAIPMHPHNAPLQWWLELGILGAFLGALMNHQCLSYIGSLRSTRAAFALGFFINISFIAYVNLGFWQNWWLSTLWIFGAIMVAFLRSNIKDSVK